MGLNGSCSGLLQVLCAWPPFGSSMQSVFTDLEVEAEESFELLQLAELQEQCASLARENPEFKAYVAP